jgi:sodium-dependent dicarboxylate transporter 2/3/5
MTRNGSVNIPSSLPATLNKGLALKIAAMVLLFAVVMLAPTPAGLTDQGQRALAVTVLTVILWTTEALPIAVSGLVGIVLLVLTGAVSDVTDAFYGFSQPVAYFLIGILSLGLAVHQSGLAQRMALFLMRGAGGSPRMLYVQMLFSFAALTFALPSASTRGAIMVHIYEGVMGHWHISWAHPLNKAVMMALGALNRLGSTALLAGGVTPVVASGLLGDFSWTAWFILMSVPFYTNLIVGGIILYLHYQAGFRLKDDIDLRELTLGQVRPSEIKAGIIVLITAVLWFTDFAHGLHPAVPALIALILVLMPGIGLLSWQEFERGLGWSNFFVLATSLTLAQALASTGAAAWFSDTLVGGVIGLQGQPLLALLVLALCFALARIVLPNIAGYLALVIPVAMATGTALGLNPLVCGMAAVVVGDSVVYYPAGGTSGLFIFQRANISAPAVFRFGLVMTVVAIVVLFIIAVPYWGLVGEPLTR